MATHETPLDPSLVGDDEPSRRDVLLIAAGGFAAIGGAAALWPLLDQMNPDASTLSMATTEVDISHVETGQAITVMWRGKPIFIRHRTEQEIAKAKDLPSTICPIRWRATPICPKTRRRATITARRRTASRGW